MNGEDAERGELAREGLGRRDADLRPAARQDHGVGLARERAARDVADREHGRTGPARGAHRAERVGRLARLRHGDHHGVRVDERAAIARFRGHVHLDRQLPDRLDDVLGGQRGVPRRAAADQQQPPRAGKDGGVETRARPQAVLAAGVDEGGDRHADGARLLVDLLEHEVRISVLLGVGRAPVGLDDPRGERSSTKGSDADAPRRQDGHLAVLDDLDLARVGQQRGDVRRQQLTAGAGGDDQRRAPVARGDDDVRLARRDDGEGEGAAQAIDRARRRLLQGQVAETLDEVNDHLGVGARREHVARALQLLSELGVIFDDAVVHDGQRARAVGVRMGVAIRGRAVRGPARVADADARPGHGIFQQGVLEIGDLAGAAADIEPVAVDDRQAGRVVSAVLEALEPFDQEGCRLLVTHIAHDPAHGAIPSGPGRDGPALVARSKPWGMRAAKRRVGDFCARA